MGFSSMFWKEFADKNATLGEKVCGTQLEAI